MPLKEFSCACEWCERAIFNLPFFIVNPKGDFYAFCSPECMRNQIDHELARSKKGKEMNGAKNKTQQKIPYDEKPWLPEKPIPRNSPLPLPPA